MCFHSKQSKKAQTLEKRFNATVKSPELFKSENHINGFTFPLTPIICDKEPETIQHFSWGLIPAWAKDESIRQYTLNARVETLHEKPSFKNSVNKRCLVLVNGFYEWQWLDSKGKNKQKYLIGLNDEEPFAFGGIWSQWLDKKTNAVCNTYSIVTTEALGLMRDISNVKKRMPIMLLPDEESSWLNGDSVDLFGTAVPELQAQKL